MKESIITFYYSLNTECPYCKVDIDLVDQDDDNLYSRAIFNNRWDDLNGEEVYCSDCDKVFLIEKIEY